MTIRNETPSTAETLTSGDAATQMQAIMHDRYGPADVLSLGGVVRPTPEADEVLI